MFGWGAIFDSVLTTEDRRKSLKELTGIVEIMKTVVDSFEQPTEPTTLSATTT